MAVEYRSFGRAAGSDDRGGGRRVRDEITTAEMETKDKIKAAVDDLYDRMKDNDFHDLEKLMNSEFNGLPIRRDRGAQPKQSTLKGDVNSTNERDNVQRDDRTI